MTPGILALVLCATGVSGGGVLVSSGAFTMSLPNIFLILYGIASSFKRGMQFASFSQLNFVARQIMGATKSLLSLLADAVFPWTVGAE